MRAVTDFTKTNSESIRREANLDSLRESLSPIRDKASFLNSPGTSRSLKSIPLQPFSEQRHEPDISRFGYGLQPAKLTLIPDQKIESSDPRPFSRSNARHYGSTLAKIVQKANVGSASTAEYDNFVNQDNARERISPAPHSRRSERSSPSRSEAAMLQNAYELLLSQITREVNGDPNELAAIAALEGSPEDLMNILEPQLFVMDTVLAELANQISAGCSERGKLLNEIRGRSLHFFSMTAVALREQQLKGQTILERNSKLEELSERLTTEHTSAVQKMAAMEIEMQELSQTNERLKYELETVKRKSQQVSEGVSLTRTTREVALEIKLQETNDVLAICKSKLEICQAQLKMAEENNGVLQAQVLELRERIQRDAEEIDCLSVEMISYKTRATWLRAILLMRRTPREKENSSTQDGPGIKPAADTRMVISQESEADASHEALRAPDISRNSLFGKDGVISFSVFWEGIISCASTLDVELDAPHMKLEKRVILEFISKMYTQKILIDEQDNRAHFPRETMPEYLYEYHLELLGDGNKAYDELIRIVANLRCYISQSARVRMFCRFLHLIPHEAVIPEALNVYLLALVKLRSGAVPLLPAYDGIHVTAETALQAVEYIFSQAPYVLRSKLLLEVEKRVQGKRTDLDSLLLYIVEQFMTEAGKSEERLKAIFVAADTDCDGQLDYTEYFKMMKHLGLLQNYRRLIRMYSEMTMNRRVNSFIFVQVCRKWKAFLFEPGPAVKKLDKKSVEIFNLLTSEWEKMESMIHEMLVLLEGSPVGQRLEDHVRLLKQFLSQKLEADEAWHCYRSIIAEFTSAVKNRTPADHVSTQVLDSVQDHEASGMDGPRPTHARRRR